MTLREIKAGVDDHLALALTIWAEARGDAADGSSLEERVAVACVIRNRVDWAQRYGNGGSSFKLECLARNQFSCWNDAPGDSNHEALLALAGRALAGEASGDPLFTECLWIADGVIRRYVLDRTGGARNYYAPKAMKPAGRVPSWAAGKPAKTIGSQVFLTA